MTKPNAFLNGEPSFNPENYNGSLMASLNFYNTEVPEEVKRDWTVAYWKNQGKNVAFFDKINESYFVQTGALVRIMERGFEIEPNHHAYLARKHAEFVAKVEEYMPETTGVKPKMVVAVKKTMEEKVEDQVRKIGSDLDAELDTIVKTGSSKLVVKVHMARVTTLPTAAKVLLKIYQPQFDEIKYALIGLDVELKEAYSHVTKKTLRSMYDFLESVVSACRQAKSIEKPRKRKIKSPAQLVAKVQYLKSYDELQMKSVTPDKIIGAETVYLFNTKLRKLFKYVAVAGLTLSVKGTSLLNFDAEKSCSKTVRKPEQFFQGMNAMTKRPVTKKFDDIRGVAAAAPGRINSDMIILKVF